MKFGAVFADTNCLEAASSVLGDKVSVEKLVKVASPLQKNQMYNWFDRYKPKEQQKVYILTAKTEEKPTLSLPLVKRRSAKKA